MAFALRSAAGLQGKEKIFYKWYATPWEILRQLPDVSRRLKADVTISELNRMAALTSDTVAAKRMQEEKKKLFDVIYNRQVA